MNPTSGLSEECITWVGRRLEVRLERGAGWRVLEDAGKRSRDFAEINGLSGKRAELMPKRFYRHHGVLRAFKALVLMPGHSLNGREVLAFSMDDGFDWDFEKTICPSWGLLFGPGEPQFPPKNSPDRWPAIFKTGIVSGSGSDLKRKVAGQATKRPPISESLANKQAVRSFGSVLAPGK